MRYWTFDVCNLIADFEKNKRTLGAIQEAMTSERISALEKRLIELENLVYDKLLGDK